MDVHGKHLEARQVWKITHMAMKKVQVVHVDLAQQPSVMILQAADNTAYGQAVHVLFNHK